ncbi:hypothetical protein AB2D90_19770 [Escherichia coli]
MVRAKKQDLAWFDISNYEFLIDLTLPDLIQELGKVRISGEILLG